MNYGFYYGFNIASSNECEMKSKESTSFRNKIFNFQKKKKKKRKLFLKICTRFNLLWYTGYSYVYVGCC